MDDTKYQIYHSDLLWTLLGLFFRNSHRFLLLMESLSILQTPYRWLNFSVGIVGALATILKRLRSNSASFSMRLFVLLPLVGSRLRVFPCSVDCINPLVLPLAALFSMMFPPSGPEMVTAAVLLFGASIFFYRPLSEEDSIWFRKSMYLNWRRRPHREGTQKQDDKSI